MHFIGFESCRKESASPPSPLSFPKQEGDESKFDEFMGSDAGVFATKGTNVYDDEDREADNIWDAVDDRMDERRKVCSCCCGALGHARWAAAAHGYVQGAIASARGNDLVLIQFFSAFT